MVDNSELEDGYSICIECGKKHEKLYWMGERCAECQNDFSQKIYFLILIFTFSMLAILKGR